MLLGVLAVIPALAVDPPPSYPAITAFAGGPGPPVGVPTDIGQQPTALASAQGKLYLADRANRVVREVSTDAAGQRKERIVAGSGKPCTSAAACREPVAAAEARFGTISALAMDHSVPPNLYIADQVAAAVRRLDPATGRITSVLTADQLKVPGVSATWRDPPVSALVL